MAQSLEEREVEAERAQRRFKARPAPDFKSKPVWSPDTRQVRCTCQGGAEA